ncbi:MAG: hypothetical protein O3B73_15965, partial [bacterium]|nr:hypothetical protein [bacterium]
QALSTFLCNRIGFCVLHAASACSGAPCVIEKTDGSHQEGQFPGLISPHQPFLGMRAITHEIAPRTKVRVAFDGDVFEMEDQRNWTDASYKTYCTPLQLPFPVEMKPGDRVRQSVTLSFEGDLPAGSGESEHEEILFGASGSPSVRLPEIGLGVACPKSELSAEEIARLRGLNMSHLRVDLHLSESEWIDRWHRAVAEAGMLGLKLEVALYVSDAAQTELNTFRETVSLTRPEISRYFVFHEEEKATSAGWLKLARSVLKEYDSRTPIGGGTPAYFTELNRNRLPVRDAECVVYSLNPQVHAYDNRSLVESLQAQSWTVESARSIAANLPISVSPITLRPRFNPNATGAEPVRALGSLPQEVDPRQMSLFGAGWTLGSLKYLGESGVRSLTYYETTGWKGVQVSFDGSPEPDLFPCKPGSVFPLYHTLAYFGGMKGGEIVPSLSSDPLRVEGAILRKGKWLRFLLANLTGEAQSVRVSFPRIAETVRVEILDERYFDAATDAPEQFRLRKTEDQGVVIMKVVDGEIALTLNPFALVCVKAVETEV